jgi:ribosomal 50S subunit-recycling heat shock protein
MSPEIEKIKKEFNKEIQKVRSEMKDMLKTSNLKNKTSSEHEMEIDPTTVPHDKSLDIVIRNLPERTPENTKELIEDMFEDGMNLRINVENAERKAPKSMRDTGIVMVQLGSEEDKMAVMKTKKSLRNNRKYKNVYIDEFRSIEERKRISNLKAIASAVGRDRLYVKGDRIYVYESVRSNNYREDDWQDVRYRNRRLTQQDRSNEHRDYGRYYRGNDESRDRRSRDTNSQRNGRFGRDINNYDSRRPDGFYDRY